MQQLEERESEIHEVLFFDGLIVGIIIIIL